MRILIGATSIFKMGGMQRVTIELANHLSERGHEVLLAGEQRKGAKIYYPCNPAIEIKNVRPYFTRHRKKYFFATLAGKSLDAINKLSRSALNQNNTYQQIAWNARYGFRVEGWRDLCLQTNPDVVIGVLPDTFTILSIALQHTNIPFIVNNHNDPVKDYSAERWNDNPIDIKKRLQAPELANANTVLLPEFKAFFSPAVQNKTYVTPNPIKEIPANLRAHPGNNNAQKTIIATGRLEPVKDHATLIKSFALIHQEFPDWQLKIFGEGKLRKSLTDLIHQLELEQQAFLCGHTDALNEEYRASHILAMPSYFEGWGLSLTEGMTHGLPAIGFDDATGINSLIQDKVTGYLADGNQRVESFAQHLRLLMQNSEDRVRMGDASVEACKHYTPEKVYRLWDDLLHKVIN